MTNVSWFPDAPPFPGVANWEYSANSGGSYAPYTGAAVAQVAGPTGTQRYRSMFAVPVGAPATMQIRWAGDLWDGAILQPSQLHLDGVLVASGAANPGPHTATFPTPTPGVHTVEIWVGQGSAGGVTQLTSVDVEAFAGPPCSCCPLPSQRCWSTDAQLFFTSAVVSNNPGGLSITGLASTIDGTAGTDLSGFAPPVTAAQLAANPTTAIDFVFPIAHNNVNRLRWFNGGGAILTDQDGFGLITFQLLDAANVILYSSPWDLTAPAGNNAVVREIAFPAVDGVSKIRVTNISKQNNAVMGAGSPLLRQIQAFQTNQVAVWPCRDPAGVIHWYRESGAEVAAADVHECPPGEGFVSDQVTNLVMSGVAFGDGPDALGENICNVVPAPTSTTNFAAPVGGCYDPANAPVSMTWTGPLNEIELSYGNPPRTSGGVIVSFSTAETGPITWPTNLVGMAVGETRLSNPTPTGGHAELTYVSGPAPGTNNAPRMEGAGNIGLHRATTEGVTPAIRFRLRVFP